MPSQLVFQAFLDTHGGETYGFEIAQATGLPSGTIYPILRRLEDDGVLSARWGVVEASGQRRRRRYYALTAKGHRTAQEATSGNRAALRMLTPDWRRT